MRLVCISDTHNCTTEITVPDGDVLIHSGDATTIGDSAQIKAFSSWFGSLPHRTKIFVAGNHDWMFERDNERARSLLSKNIIYLQDSAVDIDGLKFYGSPWQPRFFDWAFNLQRGPQLAEKWAKIPLDTNVLITHGPPFGILDEVPNRFGTENTGCEDLRERIATLREFGGLKLHVFGHIHCGYGMLQENGVTYVNASTCDEAYKPLQAPIVVDL
jgi:Icc-related predicted phosphoesterase